MDFRELRIGNVVTFDQFDWWEMGQYYFENPESWYMPLPLTEEHLTKFGFTHITQINKYEKGPLQLYRGFEGTWCVHIGDMTYSLNNIVTYVHELQNLYYALTKTEL